MNAKGEIDIPDKVQSLSISPLSAISSLSEDAWGNTWHSGNFRWSSQEGANKNLSALHWQTGLHGVGANLDRQNLCKLLDEDAVVDRVSDGTANSADGERQRSAGGDQSVGAGNHSCCSSWDNNTTETEGSKRGQSHGLVLVVRAHTCKGSTESSEHQRSQEEDVADAAGPNTEECVPEDGTKCSRAGNWKTSPANGDWAGAPYGRDGEWPEVEQTASN